MEPRLGPHELLHVFSFLEARDLLCAAQVDKVARLVGAEAGLASRSPSAHGWPRSGLGSPFGRRCQAALMPWSAEGARGPGGGDLGGFLGSNAASRRPLATLRRCSVLLQRAPCHQASLLRWA